VSKRVELLALETLPRIMPGDDLAGLILAACDRESAGPLPDDVLVVAQKIISKAEGRIVRLAEVESSPEALGLARISGKDPRIVELILRESEEIVRCVPGLIIARHRLGVVLANASSDELTGIHAALFAGVENGTLRPVVGRGIMGAWPIAFASFRIIPRAFPTAAVSRSASVTAARANGSIGTTIPAARRLPMR
jgi:hypothetical protein